MAEHIQGRTIVAGVAAGPVLASDEPLSFWGGYDQVTGEVVDRRHPLSGCKGAGKIMVLPYTRGSSTTTAILLESVRAGVAPAALVTDRADVFISLASIVAGEMYDAAFAVVVVSEEDFGSMLGAEHVEIAGDGGISMR